MAGERLQRRFAGHGITPQRAPKQCPTSGVWRMLWGSASRQGLLDTVENTHGKNREWREQLYVKGIDLAHPFVSSPKTGVLNSFEVRQWWPSPTSNCPSKTKNVLVFLWLRRSPHPQTGLAYLGKPPAQTREPPRTA